MRPCWDKKGVEEGFSDTPDLSIMSKPWRRRRKVLGVTTLLSSQPFLSCLLIFTLSFMLINVLVKDRLMGKEEGDKLNDSLRIRVKSARDTVQVFVNGITVYESVNASQRGLHVVCLHGQRGFVMASGVFDTYLPKESLLLSTLLNNISKKGRLIVMAVQDEATFNLESDVRDLIAGSLNSKLIHELHWRDTWAIVAGFKTELHAERMSRSTAFDQWGDDVDLEVIVNNDDDKCDYGHDWHRQHFCSKYEGYGEVCSCDEPSSLNNASLSLPSSMESSLGNVAVAVIASSRPHYLLRCLSSLLRSRGSLAKKVVVFVDEVSEKVSSDSESADVAAHLFNVSVVMHKALNVSTRSRTSQHYLFALTTVFEEADVAIVVEEDLEVSPDFFAFFAQTIPVLKSDPSLLCVSAWNDQGYDHVAFSSDLALRVDTMPGLGWALTRNTFRQLAPIWPSPDKSWDWDMWLRQRSVRGHRECVVPLVSRTFHFGAVGSNMNSYFQEKYFDHHAFNNVDHLTLISNVDVLQSESYDAYLRSVIGEADVVDDLHVLCLNTTRRGRRRWRTMSRSATSRTLVAFVAMEQESDWLPWARCLRLWDLDVRGQHKGVWILQIQGSININEDDNEYHTLTHDASVIHDLLVVGDPLSPFSSLTP